MRAGALLGLLAVSLAASLAYYLYDSSSEPKLSEGSRELLTAPVVERDITSTVLARGIVKPQVGAQVRVGSKISGAVEKLHANVGDRVEKGELIAILESKDLEARVSQAKRVSRKAGQPCSLLNGASSARVRFSSES